MLRRKELVRQQHGDLQTVRIFRRNAGANKKSVHRALDRLFLSRRPTRIKIPAGPGRGGGRSERRLCGSGRQMESACYFFESMRVSAVQLIQEAGPTKH